MKKNKKTTNKMKEKKKRSKKFQQNQSKGDFQEGVSLLEKHKKRSRVQNQN